MSVRVSLRGRLGNNLFQYALGRIIAERHGFALECVSRARPTPTLSNGLELDGPATLFELASHFPNAPLSIEGAAYERPVEAYEVRHDQPWRGQTIDLVSVLRNRTPRRVILDGFFQRYEYYAPYASLIRHWFRCVTVPTSYHPVRADVLVNIRRGTDFTRAGWILPASYYAQALRHIPRVGQVFVCGTQVDADIQDQLAEFRPIYVTGTPIEHFSFFQKFDRIVLSNSTFAWWAAFLSSASLIVAPRVTSGGFSFTGFEDVDLDFREARYREQEV